MAYLFVSQCCGLLPAAAAAVEVLDDLLLPLMGSVPYHIFINDNRNFT